MSKKKSAPLPNAFVARLCGFFCLSIATYFFRNWYNTIFYHASLTIFSGYILLLFIPLLLVFSYFFRDRIKVIQHYPFHLFWSFCWYTVAIVLIFLPFTTLQAWHLGTVLVYFVVQYLIFICCFLAIFGRRFVQQFLSECLLIANIAIAFLLFSFLLEKYWSYFSFLILNVLKIFLPVILPDVLVNNKTLQISSHGFSVIVGAPCAGMYSLFLFSVFFFLSLYFVRQKAVIDLYRSVFVFLLGFVVLFLLNILRIAVLVYIGARFSPEFAIGAFHEYAASVLFLIALFVYLSKILPWLVKKN